MPLTEEQKRKIRVRFQELKGRLTALLGKRNEWEKPELGKNRDWRKIAEAYWEALTNPFGEPSIDKTGRMRTLQYPDCFVCEVMEKRCFIWDGDPTHRDCPELLFEGFCYAEMPANEMGNKDTHGLYKRQIMHKRCLMRLAKAIAESSPNAPAKRTVTRYCQWHCKAYIYCHFAQTLYEQYLLCEETLEEAVKETIRYVDEIIKWCGK
jgi:hypothetical protein